MKMTGSFSLLSINMSQYRSALNAEMLRQLKEAVGGWMQACLRIIPVLTGASHGTFLKLASKIGQEFSITKTGGLPGMMGPPYGQARSQGKITTFDGAYIAEYSTTLWHLVYNEYNDGNANPVAGRVRHRLRQPGPYNFQDRTKDIFKYYAMQSRMPSPWSYITIKPKQVS